MPGHHLEKISVRRLLSLLAAAITTLAATPASPHAHPIPEGRGGLPQYRASRTGYLSYSEPHIAVNPLNPNNLVAASKMYQNLEEYLFKVGTFASFDGGLTWRDNGHLPGYPKQTGEEGGDYYITSDPWTAFDDEGNAYVMVLDVGAGESFTGAGWGMTLHKSSNGGRTWTGPIPIHRHDPVTREVAIDDKNAIVVDNTGRDRDGKTGIMHACWSYDAIVANLYVAFTRSTDGGRTWSAPQNVSGADQAVLGCQLAVGPPAEKGGPGALYVFWWQFNMDRIRMVKSVDGGETFSLPTDVATISPLPGTFANSHFRTGSLPTAAADPRTGTVYVAWADYHRRIEGEDCPEEGGPQGQVCDGDVLLVSSRDGGETWSAPVRVNRDRISNGKDQFQPALAVTARGQLNMMWFDRRNDPQNFYIDTYFARSNDGGRTWRETRVTRSMWDPSINPPKAGADFIGDYQGMAASDAFAVPFWNDTSLANLPESDRRHSPYQEVFSARIPNTAAYGGRRSPHSS